jgi:hypothetical protein
MIDVPLDDPIEAELFTTDLINLFSLSGISISGRAALIAGYSGYLNASGSMSVKTHFSAGAEMVFGIDNSGEYTQGFNAPVEIMPPTISVNQFKLNEDAEFYIDITPAMYWTVTYTYLGCGCGAVLKTPLSGGFGFYETASGSECQSVVQLDTNVGLVEYGYEVLYIPWYYDAEFESIPFTVYSDNTQHVCLMDASYIDDPSINWEELNRKQ